MITGDEKALIYRRVDEELLPQQLAWTMRELSHWREKLAQRMAEGDREREQMCREVIELLETDGRNLNRKMREWRNG